MGKILFALGTMVCGSASGHFIWKYIQEENVFQPKNDLTIIWGVLLFFATCGFALALIGERDSAS